MSGDSNNPEKSSLKDEIISLIKHEDVETIFKRYLSNSKKIHQVKLVINAVVILLGFLIGIGAFYLAYQASTTETVIATKKAYEQERATDLQARIDRKIKWMQKIDAAIINMRKVRLHIVLKCNHKKPISAYKQELQRLNARVAVVNSFTGNKYIFNENLEKKLIALVEFDESIKNVCAKHAPKDSRWQQYLLEINSIMGKSIRKDQGELKKIQN